MNREDKELLISCIKNHDLVCEPEVDVLRLLKTVKMEAYKNVCCSRIVSAGLVDEVHVTTLYGDSANILMDRYGLESCRKIIEGYVEADYLSDILDYMKCHSDKAICQNNVLYILRHLSRSELKQLVRDAAELKEAEQFVPYAELIKVELKYRNLFKKAAVSIKSLVKAFSLASDLRLPFNTYYIFIPQAYEIFRSGKTPWSGAEGRYYEALERFKKTHGGCSHPDKMKHDLLARYIFLGVKAFGKEYERITQSGRAESFHIIDGLYRESNLIMKAVGCLTPWELLQMFPVRKVYDGKENECKDYFWTMDKIRKMDMNRPIGDEYDAARLLWDYENMDLLPFLMHWEDAVYGMKHSCGDCKMQEEYDHRWKMKFSQEGA